MNARPAQHPLIQGYLDELGRLLHGIDPGERSETLAGVREHIDASLAGRDPSDDAVHAVLAEIGSAQSVAEEAYAGRTAPAPARQRAPALDRSWVPVLVAVAQAVGLLIILVVISSSVVIGESSSTSPSSGGGPVITTIQRHWDGSLFMVIPAFLAVVWLWVPVAILVGLSGLWATAEKVAQTALMPAAALVLGGAPEIGYRLASFDGITIGAWVALAAVVLGGGWVVVSLTLRAGRRVAS